MTPDEHMAAAEELAAAAADLIRTTAGEALPERMQAAETARAMAAIGRLHVDLSVVRAARPDPGDWELLATGPALAPVAPVTPIKRPQVGDVKDCECCGTSITAVPSNGTLLWVDVGAPRLHDCPPPEPLRAPADAPAEAHDQHPRKD